MTKKKSARKVGQMEYDVELCLMWSDLPDVNGIVSLQRCGVVFLYTVV